jgi:hypothetical protein
MSLSFIDRDRQVFGNLLSARELAQRVEMRGVLQSGLIQHAAILGRGTGAGVEQINMLNWPRFFVWIQRRRGAAPLSMPLGDVLPALQNRTIDGALAGTTVFAAFKYHDVVKARTRLPSSFSLLACNAPSRTGTWRPDLSSDTNEL